MKKHDQYGVWWGEEASQPVVGIDITIVITRMTWIYGYKHKGEGGKVGCLGGGGGTREERKFEAKKEVDIPRLRSGSW